jgi:hypothetical protein
MRIIRLKNKMKIIFLIRRNLTNYAIITKILIHKNGVK